MTEKTEMEGPCLFMRRSFQFILTECEWAKLSTGGGGENVFPYQTRITHFLSEKSTLMREGTGVPGEPFEQGENRLKLRPHIQWL